METGLQEQLSQAASNAEAAAQALASSKAAQAAEAQQKASQQMQQAQETARQKAQASRDQPLKNKRVKVKQRTAVTYRISKRQSCY